MKKEMKIVFTFLLTLFSLNFVSAYFHYYGNPFGNLFYGINSPMMAQLAFFTIIFVFVFMAMSRILKDPHGNPNTGSAAIGSLAFSFLVTYWIRRSRFDLGYYFYLLESSGILLIVVILIIIFGVWFVLSRFGKKKKFDDRRYYRSGRRLGPSAF